MRPALELRPKAGALVVPYMVDACRNPVDFRAVDEEHVKRCATARRCGICGAKIRSGPLAFIGPDDGRRCFADPWMHEDCARLSMTQCPFLAGRSGWREEAASNPVLEPYAEGMAMFTAPDGNAHRGKLMEWHFQAVGELVRA